MIRRSVRLAGEREVAPKLSPVDGVTHYAYGALPRERAKTQRLIKSMRKLHEADAR